MTETLALNIRPATAEDLPHILEIERLSFPASSWHESDFKHHDVVVAMAPPGDRLAGFIVTREIAPAVGELGSEREILNLAVHPEWRNKGVGRALLERELKRGGSFFLEVRPSNTAARNLYTALGFKEIGTRPDYYHHPPESAIVMKLN